HTMEAGTEETSFLKELPLLIFSSLLGPAGIAAAYYPYIRNPQLPGRLANACRKCYRALLNKFYVDEAYQAIFINPAYHGAVLMWKEIDVKLVDGAVNGMAKVTRGAGRIARRWQSGFSRHYAMTLVLGLALLLIYYFRLEILWRLGLR
ncbi:MAG: hypothetical protein HYV00_08665, partial [Deltaproteobacteria bacterium]|nr:hypothetical protein [Deltaproteobacteria bacterium]